MPNWCDCSMVIYTDDESKKDNIQKVYNLLAEQLKRGRQIEEENRTLPASQRKHLHWDTYEVYKTLCPELTEEEICGGNLYYIRGTIFDVRLDEIDNTIHVGYETAWEPMTEGWGILLAKYGLKQVTIAEEPACEVYVNTDIDGRWFKDRYIIEMCIDDNNYKEYYELIPEALADMEKYFHKKFRSLNDFLSFVKRINDKKEGDYIVFAKFCSE